MTAPHGGIRRPENNRYSVFWWFPWAAAILCVIVIVHVVGRVIGDLIP